MAVTTTTALNGSTQALYLKDYMMATTGQEFFDQLCDVRKALNGERGATVDWVIYEGMDVATSTLTEGSDITPVAMADTPVSITVSEYFLAPLRGNAWMKIPRIRWNPNLV